MLGGMFVAHLYWKAHGFKGSGQDFVASFAVKEFPPALAYYIVSAEVLGALLLIPGIFTRAAAVYAIPLMGGAAYLWFKHKLIYFAPATGELPVFWGVMLLIQALLGDGAGAIRPPTPPPDT